MNTAKLTKMNSITICNTTPQCLNIDKGLSNVTIIENCIEFKDLYINPKLCPLPLMTYSILNMANNTPIETSPMMTI